MGELVSLEAIGGWFAGLVVVYAICRMWGLVRSFLGVAAGGRDAD